jgi:hypothetical protein
VLSSEPVAQQRGDAGGFLDFVGRGCLPLLRQLALTDLSGFRLCSHGGPL